MRQRRAVCNLLVAWVLMMPPAAAPPFGTPANLSAPLSRWNLAGRFFLGEDVEKQCEKTREAFIADGKRLAALKEPSLMALSSAEIAARCLSQSDPQLDPTLRQVLDEPFWLKDFARYPSQTESHVMASSKLLMPPAAGAYGRLKTRTDAPLSEWSLAGDYATPEECEKEQRHLWQIGHNLPVNEAIGLKPLADAEMNTRCVAPDDTRAKGVLPWIGLFEPPVTDVPYLNYPDQNSRDYRASDVRDLNEDSRAVKRWTTSFPGPPDRARSSDGRYELTNAVHREEVADEEDRYSVLVVDRQTGKKELLYKYDRSIDIIWSPFSRMIALNDYYGSNVSQSLVFNLAAPERKVDVGEQLAKSNRPRREKLSVETADHVYPHVVRWIARDQLIFKIFGYNGIDRDGFTLAYLYDVSDNSFVLLEFLHRLEKRAV